MKSVADRQREWRKKRREAGYQMLTVWLDPDVVGKLESRLKSTTKQAERQQLVNEVLRQNL